LVNGFAAGRKSAPGSVAWLTTDEQRAHKLADRLIELLPPENAAVSLADEGDGRWRLSIYLRALVDEHALHGLIAAGIGQRAAKALRFVSLAQTDWIRESLAGLSPVVAGRFVVHGTHDRDRIPASRIGIEIDAALAFGTGHHGTTRGCLLALDRLCKRLATHRLVRHRRDWPKSSGPDSGSPPPRPRAHAPAQTRRRVLDVGTGSGVLAMAAARALHWRVLAADIDPLAVRVARENARRNGVGPLIKVIKADGVGPLVRARAPCALIFANILLEPLRRIAPALRRLAAPGGRVVLSGLLPSQANAAIAAYRPLVLERRLHLDGWATLVLARPRGRVGAVARPGRRL
jgi:ribosomal protein L11 methyltransferase